MKNISRGFTLIETLMYLGLFSIIIGGLTVSAYSFFELSGRNQYKAVLQNEQDFLIAKINMVVRNAQSVTIPAAGASASVLDATGNTIALGNSGTVTLNGFALNATGTTISNVVFIHTYAGGSNPESIEAGFTISLVTPSGSYISQSASTTNFLRK